MLDFSMNYEDSHTTTNKYINKYHKQQPQGGQSFTTTTSHAYSRGKSLSKFI